ncbi:DUF6310 domain-containing protein [Myxococcus fulvus]|uniref:DUF6310 domain-containing protein n=1 Tax=Myxococcus fulvus TaxID=33 RepID=UPI002805D268|nr:DUF6310 domain-containing protein [Myxococcus fulvus]
MHSSEPMSASRRSAVARRLVGERHDASDLVACGYDFVVGVSTEEHQRALLDEIPTLNVVVTGCPR